MHFWAHPPIASSRGAPSANTASSRGRSSGALGFGRGAIVARVRAGRLHRVHHGVYAVGHARLALRGQLWAAVLACGGPEAAVLSHRGAAALWDLGPTPAGALDVTTLRSSHSRPGIPVHRSRTLDPARNLAFEEDGLPLTSVTRTLVDLADVLSPHRVERLCHRAGLLRLLDAGALRAALDELPGRRAHVLQAALATLAVADPDVTRSELEERFLELVARAGLPRPRVNARVGPYEVDFLWPERRVVAETDGAAAHGTRTAFEADRRRDAELRTARFEVARFTWRLIVHEPAVVAGALRTLLTRRR